MSRTQSRTSGFLCTFLLIFLVPIWYLSSGSHKGVAPSQSVTVVPEQIEPQHLWHDDIDPESDLHSAARILSTKRQKRALQVDDAAAKGCKRLEQMSGSAFVPDAPVFGLVDTNAWEESKFYTAPDDLQDAFAGLGISFTTGNTQVLWQNIFNTKRDNRNYAETYASYDNVFNPTAGLIISLSNWDPKSQVGGTAVDWPPLHRYSDVTWEQAKVVPDSNVGNLRYWIRHHIANSDTLGIIDSLFSGNRNNAPLWPGVDYAMSTVQGRALLGTPNGAGVAWYIAQHTDEIGRRLTVSKGKVFRTQSNGVDYVNILFYIVPLR